MDEQLSYGKAAIKERRTEITDLINVVKGNRGWRESFFEIFPHFKTIDGDRLLNAGTRGTCDDIELLRCLRIFIPWVRATQPDWFVKQFQVSIP